jgi:hypothetical protein
MRSAALWMVYLVIMLPIVSAQAMASISVNKFSGKDNIADVARGNDLINIEAAVALPNDNTIDRSQFHILTRGADYVADSCNVISGSSYLCNFKQTLSGGYGTIDYTLQLLDDTQRPVETKTRTLKVDRTGAQISAIASDSKVNSKQAKIEFTAIDTLTGSGTSACSGLDKADLYVGGVTGSPVKSMQLGGSCSESSSFIDLAFGKTGEQDICVTAYDVLGQTSGPKCQRINIDAGPPVVGTANVTDQDGEQIKYITSGGTVADIAVKLGGGDVTSVRADLNTVTGKPEDVGVAPSTILGDNPQIAIWKDVQITSASACQLKIYAEDDVSNTIDKVVNCGLTEDNSPPALASMTSALQDTAGNTSTPVIGRTGQVIATISEAGSGLSKRYVYLNGVPLGLSNRLRASNCTASGDSWTCTFNVKPAKAGYVLLKLSDATRDDAGNPLERASNAGTEFLSDQASPSEMKVVSVKTLHGTQDLGNVTVRGDFIEYQVQAKYFSTATADFTGLGGNISTCTQRSGDICTYSTLVDISGPADVPIAFTFSDSANNNATLRHTQHVLGIRNDSNPNYWSNEVICTPSMIDRSVTSLINTRIYCHIALKSNTPDIKTVLIDFNPQQCTGDVANVGDLGLSNNYAGSTEPILYALLSATEFKVNSLDFKCPLKITSRVGDFLSINAENETVNVHLSFFSRPQSDLSKSVLSKFNKAKSDALKLDGLIGTLKKFFEVAEKICQIRGMIMNALNAIDSVMALIEYIKAGALRLEPAIVPIIPACETPKSAGMSVAPGTTAGIKASYQPSTANAQLEAQKAKLKELKDAKQLDSLAAKLKVNPADVKPSDVSVSQADICKAQEKINANRKITEKESKQNNKAALETTDKGVTATKTAAQASMLTYDVTCDGMCIKKATVAAALSFPASPGGFLAVYMPCKAICIQEVNACKTAIDAFSKMEDLHKKVEQARSKMCNNKEGMVEKFKCAIDKFAAPFCNFVNCDWGPTGANGGTFGKFESFMGKINPNNYIKVGGIGAGIPVKESLVWSVASLCIPGIINNVDKYRQIDCEYALCIGKDVVEHGLPISACEKKKEALMCNFIWGQVFNSIPFVGTVEGWINTLKEFITNPIAAITFILGQYCKPFCDESRSDLSATHYRICAFPKTLDALAAVVKDIQSIIKPEFWKLSESKCDELKSYKPKSVAKPATTPSGTVGPAVVPGQTQGTTVPR